MASPGRHLAQQSRLWSSLSCSSSHELRGEVKPLSFSVPQFPHRSNFNNKTSFWNLRQNWVSCCTSTAQLSHFWAVIAMFMNITNDKHPRSREVRHEEGPQGAQSPVLSARTLLPRCVMQPLVGSRMALTGVWAKLLLLLRSCIYFHGFYLWQANPSPIYYCDTELPFYINVVTCK